MTKLYSLARLPGGLRSLALSATLFAVALAPASASASFHFMKIVEVFAGTAAAPNAQYVVLQMYAAGQNMVGTHSIIVYNAAGTEVGRFTFTGSVPIGTDQSKILIATPEATTFFGGLVTADLAMTAIIPRAGGKVCFDAIDCVAWGNYSGSTTGVGPVFDAAVGIRPGTAIIRRLDIAGGATNLENADDTNDSANDFRSGTPAPRNNLGITGTVPASSCGNSMVTGLEQCDDGNTSPGDTCDSMCRGCVLDDECSDDDPCTTATCEQPLCAFNPTPTDDGNPCTADGCNGSGVFHDDLADGTTCPGIVRSICLAGVCEASTCGDGFVDAMHSETCDDGPDNGMVGSCNSTCNGTTPDGGMPDADAAMDAAEDAMPDATEDAMPDADATEDAMPDAEPDAAEPDATVDASSDAMSDAAPPDSGRDAMADGARPDAAGDGGPRNDASDGGRDAGRDGSGRTGDDEGGCDCRAAGSDRAGAWVLGLLALAVVMRRRRRR